MIAGAQPEGDAASGDTAVLIVGAGAAGLVLACELARRAVPFRVIDAEPRAFRGSRAKGLQPRSLELLHDLGLADRVISLGRTGLQVRSYRGHQVLGTHDVNAGAGDPTPAMPYTRPMVIPQWRLEDELRGRLTELGGAVERPVMLTALEQDQDGVTATLRDAGGQPQCLRARYVVGCDGASSTVRRLLGIGFLGETDETLRMLVGDLTLAGLDREYWHMWPQLGDGVLALCPLPSTDTFQIQVNVPTSVRGDLDAGEVQRIIEVGTARTDITVREVRWQSIWRLNVRMVDRYRLGRVFLAGDAAHVHSPAGGLGLNTGMQDAANLAWKLAHVVRGAPDELLDTYEEERLPVAAATLGLSGRLISRGIAGILAHGGQPEDTLQLSLNYRGARLSEGSSKHGQAAPGDRAPDSRCRASGGRQVRLFDLFRGAHVTALAFGPRSAEAASRLALASPDVVRLYQVTSPGTGSDCLPARSVLADQHGFARRDYAAKSDDLVIVRPDGYIGLRLTEPGPEAVGRYLEGMLPRQAFPVVTSPLLTP